MQVLLSLSNQGDVIATVVADLLSMGISTSRVRGCDRDARQLFASPAHLHRAFPSTGTRAHLALEQGGLCQIGLSYV